MTDGVEEHDQPHAKHKLANFLQPTNSTTELPSLELSAVAPSFIFQHESYVFRFDPRAPLFEAVSGGVAPIKRQSRPCTDLSFTYGAFNVVR